MDSLLNTYLTLLKMSENDPRYDSMLFNYETTMKNDFRNGAILNIKRTVYEEKPKCLKTRPPPLKDIHTMTDWKTPYIPIDLLIKPKDIVHTNPREIQEPYTKLEDGDLCRVRATRPRVFMTPALCLDDIPDEQKRERLINETYTTTAKKAMELGTAARGISKPIVAPLPEMLSPPQPLNIERVQFPYVSAEWRMDSVTWDRRQLRGHCDSDKNFYLKRTPRCKICDETAEREKIKKFAKKIKHPL